MIHNKKISESEFLNYENYILADDKQQFLKTLIPGTDPYYYFTLLHTFKTSTTTNFSTEIIKMMENYKQFAPNKANILNL